LTVKDGSLGIAERNQAPSGKGRSGVRHTMRHAGAGVDENVKGDQSGIRVQMGPVGVSKMIDLRQCEARHSGIAI